MFFSIIIINYKTLNVTSDCLDSIFKNCYKNNFEIIVIDNASGDGSAENLEKIYGNKIRIIKNRKNLGFGTANNQGANIAKGEYLFFLNSDTIVREDVLAEIRDYLCKHHGVGLLAPKLIVESGNEQEEAFGDFPTLFSAIFSKFIPPKRYRDVPFKVDWASGAAMIIGKEIFLRLGGFDENYFMYYEDIDLCRRIKFLGLRVVVFPSIKITHLVAQSESSNIKRKNNYYASQDYYFKKHYGYAYFILIRTARWPYRFIRNN